MFPHPKNEMKFPILFQLKWWSFQKSSSTCSYLEEKFPRWGFSFFPRNSFKFHRACDHYPGLENIHVMWTSVITVACACVHTHLPITYCNRLPKKSKHQIVHQVSFRFFSVLTDITYVYKSSSFHLCFHTSFRI